MPRSLLFLLFTAMSAQAAWQAGAAKVDITPTESVPLAGYGGKTRMSNRILHPIWIKALALKDASGATSVLVTADLVGLSTKMVDIIAKRAKDKHGIPRERLVLNYSHNHSCPVTADVLWLYYDLSPAEAAARDRYTYRLYDQYDEVIGKALANLAPAEMSFDQGLAGFAVNRRRSRPGGRKFGGQVDHDVPVIAARAPGGQLRAFAFGYSCHTTALSGETVNGDYAGFAQIELEKSYPGAVALFVQNCGGDANPLPRVMRSNAPEAIGLAEMYGKILAEGVRQVLDRKMLPLDGPIRASMSETEIFFQKAPTLEELRQKLATVEDRRKREVQHLIDTYKTKGKLPDGLIYPVQVWNFGPELTFIALSGETVADYCLRFKRVYGWDTTWVAGYNNDLTSYVPSLRVLREGDYEGTTGIYEYGHPAPYSYSVEEQIAAKVEELVQQVRK
ncbi:MAG: neutral/alkaline non-lysosomal ceramidase N-terminal domain-containing protein [Bryobacteraceae bacterium]